MTIADRVTESKGSSVCLMWTRRRTGSPSHVKKTGWRQTLWLKLGVASWTRDTGGPAGLTLSTSEHLTRVGSGNLF